MKLERFLEKAFNKFQDKYDYSLVNYINNKIKICIICKIHGKFFQSPSSHLQSVYGCKKCALIKSSNKHAIDSEEFFKRANIFHNNKYDYSLSAFVKLTDFIKIKCPIHGIFSQRAKVHLKCGCKKCRDLSYRKSIYDFIINANIIHNHKYDYSKSIYKNNKIKLKIICPIHKSFMMKPNAHLNGDGCPKCTEDIRRDNLLIKFIEGSSSIHNNFYDYSLINKIKTVNDKIIVVCPIHGIFRPIAWQHMEGSICFKCSKQNRALTQDEFLKKAIKIHNNKYDYSLVDYKLSSIKIKIICSRHGIFEQLPSSHIYTKSGCPNCSKIVSKMETRWLNYLNIPNRFRNKKLVIKKRIFYPDGYDPETKTLYEFYGDYWHGNIKIYNPNDINTITKMRYIDLYNRTMEKEKYIKNSGYKIISIWESDWKIIESKLNEII